MSHYSVVDIVREPNPLYQQNPSLKEFLFVAVIQDSRQEQPFRVVIENFETVEEAKEQIDTWIRCREEEDARRADEAAREVRNTQDLTKLGELKNLY